MSDRREAWARAFFPRTTENALQERGLLRGVLAGVLDAASLPGRGYAAMWNRYNEPVLEGMARTGADSNSPLALSVAEGIARDPLTLLSAPVGGLAGPGGRALASGVGGALLRRAAPVAVDAAANTGLAALAQYGTEGRVNLADLAMGAGVGAGMHGAGDAMAKMAPAARAKILENPNFRKWFGDSKVVDEAGNPLVVYHGTDADFNVFDPSFAGSKTNDESGYVEWSKVGPNFTTNPKYASEHAEGLGYGSVMPAHAMISNPYEMTDRDWSSILREMESGEIDASAFRSQLSDDGYDGILMDVLDNGIRSTHVIPFEPTQIKSATGNRGTFDPNDPNITHFAGGQSPIAGAQGLLGRYMRGVMNQRDEREKR